MAAESTEFSPWLARWGLEPDGWAFQTTCTRSLLLPVRQDGVAAMLKVATERTEIAGGAVMAWWDGEGAAPVLAHDGPALLMVRAEGHGSLIDMVAAGGDDAATEIICHAVAELHRPRLTPPPSCLETPERWFRALRREGASNGAFARANAMLDALIAEPREQVVLHGDIHHGNVMDFGALGWRVIDPKGTFGERAYEYANILKNPDLATTVRPGRANRLLDQISQLADLDRDRLRRWALVHAALSAAWSIEDGFEIGPAMEVVDFLWAELAEPAAR